MSGSRKLGPSYDEERYWDDKFKANADTFEWLGSGSILLDAFYHAHLSTLSPPRTLHLGAGTSKLSLDLARHYITVYGSLGNPLNKILNVDFSQRALTIGTEQAISEKLQGMQYLRIDLRIWKECQSILMNSNNDQLHFILDKSTSDSISTNPDINLESEREEYQCPLFNGMDTKKALDPLDLVAVHLAALSKIGCLWAVLSYSSSRFEIFDSPSCHSKSHWKVLQKSPISAPNGNSNAAFTPQVFHWFYLLQRL